MLVYCGQSYSCVFSPRPVTGSFTCTSKNHTINFFTLNIHAVLFEDNFALLITFYSYRTRTLTRLKPKMHSTQVLKVTHNLCLVYNENTHLSRSVLFVATLQYIFSLRRISLFVTVFWKTDHLDTTTEIHLLPVRDRHTHALSRNTKH